MTRKSLLDQVRAIQMARTYCLLVGSDPDEIVAGYFVDAMGQRRRVSKARWRWYQDIAETPAPDAPQPGGLAETAEAQAVPDRPAGNDGAS